jgi:hypothetical protein
MEESHPFSIRTFWRELVHPYWTINNAKCLSEAKHEPHWVEDPHVVGGWEQETSKGITYHEETEDVFSTELLKNGRDE